MNVHYLQHVPFEGLGSIARWLKDAGYPTTATRFFADDPIPEPDDVEWLFVMGGPMSVFDEHKYPWLVAEKRFIERVVSGGKVVVGICLGAQLVANVLGARVFSGCQKEIGWFPIERTGPAKDSEVGRFLPAEVEVFHWHGDTFDLPNGAIHLARSKAYENQAFAYNEHVLGLQFHLEITPSSVQDLLRECAQELVEGPYVQTPKDMTSNTARFQRVNKLMRRLFDRIKQQREQ